MNIIKNLLLAILISITLQSCKKEVDIETSDVTIDSVEAVIPEKPINQDSINKANELKIKLIADEKERRTFIAEDSLDRFTYRLMKIVSPFTGKRKKYVMENITFDETTSRLDADFESSWYAIPDYDPSTPEQEHIFYGHIIIYNDETIYIRQRGINDVLQYAVESNRVANGIATLINEYEQNKNNN